MNPSTTKNHVNKRNYLRHLLPVAVWLVAVGLVVWLFHQRGRRFQVMGIAQGQVRQVATNCPGRIKNVSVALYDRVTEGQIVAVVDTVLDNEYNEEVLRARLATLTAEIQHLLAQLVPTQDDLMASQKDRETTRISDLRRFTLDVESARLRILELKAQLATDRMTLQDLASEVAIAEDLVRKKAVAPYELEKAKAQYEVLAQSMAENTHLLEQAEAHLDTAQMRLTDYADRPAHESSVQDALEVIHKEIGVQERLMQEVSAQLNAIEQRRVLELTAPADGVVSQVWLGPGEAVTAGVPILTITVAQPAEVIGYAQQSQVDLVRENMEVEVAKMGAPLKPVKSRVTFVGPAVEQMPTQLWQNPTMPQYGRPFKVQLPPNLPVIPGEVVGIRGL
jgi:multidrug resistance efflux pump